MNASQTSADAADIIRRAHARGEQPQAYDPHQLVKDVAGLLRERGLSPDKYGRAGMATAAAGMLLRAFDILPATDYSTIDTASDPEMR